MKLIAKIVLERMRDNASRSSLPFRAVPFGEGFERVLARIFGPGAGQHDGARLDGVNPVF
jgi:hypothetical protein